jgi:Zn-finger nucleic acid-binding protein
LITYAEKELFQCAQCRGFWFTNGLFKEVKQVGFAELCSGLGSADETEEHQTPDTQDLPELTCPACGDQPLVAYNYAYSSDIQLYRCVQCKGIWADQAALLSIEQLLVNYQESLEDAKSKALPLMMEVKRQFKEKEEAWEAERRKQKKGLLGKFFRKKSKEKRKPVDIFEDIHHENNQDQEE